MLGAEKPDHTVLSAPRRIGFRPTSGTWATLSGRIRLAEGENLITVMSTDTDRGAIALNHIDIR